MRLNPFKKKQTKLDEEIDMVLTWLKSKEPGTEEYTKMAANLKTLYEIRNSNKNNKIKPETIVLGACNLIGIWLILNYEEYNIVTSKALGFVLKGRV